ncbi:MAG: NAD-dependent epimerase/dehydratase family protein [Nocardioidaceae bacterium]|nr:NAD-dependent epimerase/dehydratase family protein [Nocardioidaceae bacterium]
MGPLGHVLVTGAAGFIGSQLCAALVARGWSVRGLDAFNDFYDPLAKRRNVEHLLESPAFDLLPADLATAALDEVLDDVDAVAHLAGEPGVSTSWGPAFPRYVDRNVLATQRLLEAVCSRGLRRFVFASSSSVYGAGNDVLRARGEPRPTSPYGVTKLAGEALVGSYAYSFGLPAVSLRYFSVYGPRQRPDMAAHRFIEALLDGRPPTVFGDGTQVRDYTYVGDVVDATMRALTADLPPAAVLDIASASPVDVRTLLATLRELMSADDVPVTSCEARRGDVPRTAGDISMAQEWLGWSPTVDLRTGLARQIEWHRGLREQWSAPHHLTDRPLAAATGD